MPSTGRCVVLFIDLTVAPTTMSLPAGINQGYVVTAAYSDGSFADLTLTASATSANLAVATGRGAGSPASRRARPRSTSRAAGAPRRSPRPSPRRCWSA